ncbi:hypothetical protein GCM10011416_09750 [Polaribacter pacificus]|uniref:Uncharacterized protein n=1 Tax=Polaribacter pacificus TaxID=1775173 RepID=A0A917HXF1_9FLAO|nr:hypothetical protein [Polaribacter pacificus]GGG94461.1 hypothetical protein GCM10011416_09750 [Polaribacter pacificus]
MHKIKKTLFFLLVFLTLDPIHAQCAMCKAVVENGGEPMAEGINSGITYLMAFPYILVAILAYSLYRYKKRVKN